MNKHSTNFEPTYVKVILILIATIFLTVLIVFPLLIIFIVAFRKGAEIYLQTFQDPYAIKAIELTLLVAAIAVPVNMIFGLAVSWTITKFNFVGKHFLMSLIDLPFFVSPVIAGFIYVLLFGSNTLLGEWMIAHDIRIIFAVPGLVFATVFVTFPLIARGLIPLMRAHGTEDEEAAILLGANGWQTFRKVTLPNIKWGLFYSVLLCNARAMGEFGAVLVVSGHIQGKTNTIPLYMQILYNQFNLVSAFGMASMLTLLALLTVLFQTILESKEKSNIGKHMENIIGYSD